MPKLPYNPSFAAIIALHNALKGEWKINYDGAYVKTVRLQLAHQLQLVQSTTDLTDQLIGLGFFSPVIRVAEGQMVVEVLEVPVDYR